MRAYTTCRSSQESQKSSLNPQPEETDTQSGLGDRSQGFRLQCRIYCPTPTAADLPAALLGTLQPSSPAQSSPRSWMPAESGAAVLDIG